MQEAASSQLAGRAGAGGVNILTSLLVLPLISCHGWKPDGKGALGCRYTAQPPRPRNDDAEKGRRWMWRDTWKARAHTHTHTHTHRKPILEGAKDTKRRAAEKELLSLISCNVASNLDEPCQVLARMWGNREPDALPPESK